MLQQGRDIVEFTHQEHTKADNWSTFLPERDSDTTEPADEVTDESDDGEISGVSPSQSVTTLHQSPPLVAPATDEDDWIDIEPEEGQRRGRELLMMLRDGASSDHSGESVPVLPPPPPISNVLLRPKLSAGASMFVPLQCGTSTSVNFQSSYSYFARETAEPVQEAAMFAFGSDLEEVTGDADTGLVVKVSNTAGYWDAWAALATLSTALGSFVGSGREIVSLEPSTESELAEIKMHCVKAGADVNGQCWEHFFSTCPRSARCRWSHDRVIVNVEVQC